MKFIRGHFFVPHCLILVVIKKLCFIKEETYVYETYIIVLKIR